MPYSKPMYVMFQDGIPEDQRNAVISGIGSVLRLGGASCLVQVSNFGTWREQGFHSNGSLVPYLSVDWYVEAGRRESKRRGQSYAKAILNQLWNEPWQKNSPHYDVVVVKDDIYDDGANFIIGGAIKGFGTVISTHRFQSLERNIRLACLETETIHEIGHVFGLVPEDRTVNVERSLGLHCTSRCVMRQGLSVPSDWIRYTHDRIESGQLLCPQCIADLRNYFLKGN